VTGTGTEFSTQVIYALEYLKKKIEPKSLVDILQYLSINPNVQRGLANKIVLALKHHPNATYIPDPKSKNWDAGTFQYLPRIPVRTKAELVTYLQTRPDAQGIRVSDLKDGYPDVEDAIDELEKENKILVSRVKKENRPKMVWTNDPTLVHEIDPEFQALWHKTELPSVDEVVRKLLEAGQKPASEDPSKRVKVATGNKEKKKRKPRAGGKTTNTHMQHLLKDYSHLKR
jgi:transcription initiation factor TFIIE subunit beta